MAEIHGNQGAIFERTGNITAATIAFVDSGPDTITDSDSGFVDAGFTATTITVSGAAQAGNNDSFTIDTGGVAAGTLTLVAGDALTGEIAGNTVTISTIPGTQLGGFFSWTLNIVGDVHDVTDFADGTARTFIAGLSSWTGTAEKHFLTGAEQGPAIGEEVLLRFFIIYAADPTATTNYYYEGTAQITGITPTTPVDSVVTSSLSFQGSGDLTFVTRVATWG